MHSYKLLDLSESDIYIRIQCERQSSKPLRYFTIPIVCIYMSQFILLPSFYYKTLSHSLLLLSDNKYFPILFAFLYMPLIALPAINFKYKMLDFFLIMAMLTKLLLFTKRFWKFLILFVVIMSYIVFICYEIYMFLQFCSIFYLHISVPSETFIPLEVFISVIPFCIAYWILFK